jgi:hypothetical protein
MLNDLFKQIACAVCGAAQRSLSTGVSVLRPLDLASSSDYRSAYRQ